MFSDDYFLPHFAKQTCNHRVEKLQSFLARSSKHYTHARVRKKKKRRRRRGKKRSGGIHTELQNLITEFSLCRFLDNLCFKLSPQTDQKPIVTFLAGTEEGPPIQRSARSHFLFLLRGKKKSRTFHSNSSSFLRHVSFFRGTGRVSWITDLYSNTSYECARAFLLVCLDRPDCSAMQGINIMTCRRAPECYCANKAGALNWYKKCFISHPPPPTHPVVSPHVSK